MKKFICFTVAVFCVFTAGFPFETARADIRDWQIVDIPSGAAENTLPFALKTGYLAADIATDREGRLYIMAESNIYRFDIYGHPDTAWADGGVLHDGELEQTDSEQMRIVIDSRGYIYASCRIRVDGSPAYIKRYTPEGRVDTAWFGDGVMGGKVGPESIVADEKEKNAGGVSGQEDIALDAQDNLYVLHGRKVYRFTREGRLDNSYRPPELKQPETPYEEAGYPNFIRVRPDGSLCVFNGYDGLMKVYGQKGVEITSGAGTVYYADKDESGARFLLNDLDLDGKGNIVTLNHTPEETLSKFTPSGELVESWGKDGVLDAKGLGLRDFAIEGLATDQRGNIYLLDAQRGIVRRVSGEGKSDTSWGMNGAAGNVDAAGNSRPSLLSVESDEKGSIYILKDIPWGEAAVYRLNSAWQWDDWEENGGEAGYGVGKYSVIAPGPDGKLFVVDKEKGRDKLYALTRQGKKESPGFDYKAADNANVRGIRLDAAGNSYLFDSSGMVYRFLPDGSRDAAWGDAGGIGTGMDLKGVSDVLPDNKGRLYVADSQAMRILRFDEKGVLDRSFGAGGIYKLPEPASAGKSMRMAPGGNGLYVADSANKRILRIKDDGRLDEAWQNGGIVMEREADAAGLSELTGIAVINQKLYAIWDKHLYVFTGETPAGSNTGTIGGGKENTAPDENKAKSAGIDWIAVLICISGIAFIAAIWILIRAFTRENRRK